MQSSPYHTPVLLREVLEGLAPRPGALVIDGTVGGGGHARALLQAILPGGRLVGIDRDPGALRQARRRLEAYGDGAVLIQGNYSEMTRALDEAGVGNDVDGVLLDIGVSSAQLERPEKGFSYRHDAPLDMRMDPAAPITAADLLNTLDEGALAGTIKRYGEERWASRIAKFVVERRRRHPFERTGELVETIKAAIPAGARRSGPHPAKRTFQALRISVNDELAELERGITAAVRLLRDGGRLCVITFHSLEDRIVKQSFRVLATGENDEKAPIVRIVTKRPITASQEELDRNPRARSAKLRVAERRSRG